MIAANMAKKNLTVKPENKLLFEFVMNVTYFLFLRDSRRGLRGQIYGGQAGFRGSGFKVSENRK